METEFFYLDGAHIEIELPIKMLEYIPLSGFCDSYVAEAYEEFKEVFKDLKDQDIVRYLDEFAVWEPDELKDRVANLHRLIWILAGEYNDRLYIEPMV